MTLTQKEVCRLFKDTTLTQQAIADITGCTNGFVSQTAKKYFSAEFRRSRKQVNYKASKLGDLNPMYGKFGDEHHNFKGRVSDNKGYMMVLKPDWYTARKGSKHVFEHHVVYCLAHGLTEIPHGHCVHHLNQNKVDNRPDNLVMLTLSDHMRLHARLRHAETIRKE